MSAHSDSRSGQAERKCMIFQTREARWVVPPQCDVVKLLIEKQSITAEQLSFSSPDQCHCFVRRLLLLALQDEIQANAPSALADLARGIIHSLSASTHQHLLPRYA